MSCMAQATWKGTRLSADDVIALAERQRRSDTSSRRRWSVMIDAAVVAVDDPLGILGIDPDVVVVAVVRALDVLEGLAAVDALEQRHLRAPDHVRVGRDRR